MFLKRNRLKTIEYLNQNRELEVLDYSENEVTTLNECEYNLPTSIIDFNLSSNQIKSILAPRTLFWLSKLEKLNFTDNPFTKTLSSNKIDVVHFILSLLIDWSLKHINNKKLTHTDFKRAKEFYKDRKTGSMSKEILKRTLLMEIDESELLTFLTFDDNIVSKSIAFEEVKELVYEENYHEEIVNQSFSHR